ncbi:MAG: NAD(P)-dependent oxidoreductase [Candidatus Methanoperedens sp.]|nr:NAD(P)-dependent oxidoreductase [Candidatus Methanoperedens sp.]
MRILVTGGAGYIGSILVPELLKIGHEVIVMDNFMYNQTSLLDYCHDEKLAIIRGDARDKKIIPKCLEKVDAIFPLACLTGAPLCSKDALGAQTTNFDAIKMLLDLCRNDQMIIFPTTNSGYGIGQKDKFCTEETPLNPISLYGRTKVEAEKIILEHGNSISLRLATVFGLSPRMRIDLMVNDFVYRAVNDRFIVLFEGHFKRNFIHIRDVARAFIHALENFDEMKNEPYNVGLSDANISKIELCAKIKKQLPDFVYLEAPVGEDTDKRDYLVSNEKIEKTGFRPEFTLDMGIKELIKGYNIIKNTKYGNV